MNYEERYKEALERARDLMTNQNPPAFDKDLISIVFPELAESEGERIRKELIRIFKGEISYTSKEDTDKYIAWLEKQKEPEDKGEISDGYHTFNELYRYRMLYNAAFFNLLPKELVHKSKKHHDGKECFGGGWFIVMANLPTGQISNHYELKDWDLFQVPEKYTADEWDGHTPQEAADRLHRYLLEKQSEQKPNDKVKPKFKVGDWIILPLGIIAHIDSINSTDYQVTTTDGKICDFKISEQDNYRLWAIADANDGDVLMTTKTRNCPFIYRKTDYNNHLAYYYAGVDGNGDFCEGCLKRKMYHFAPVANITPATKEQYDLLFRKMKEAGYVWDADKKEPKKISTKK